MSQRRVLVLVQNLPLPRDRRVWLECRALRDAGFEVSAITPMAEGDQSYELLDGIHLYKYPPPREAKGVVGFAWEFLYCLIQTYRLMRRVYQDRGGLEAIQACNPPDTFWILALLFKRKGVRFVYDQHDLCPEVYLSRFPKPSPILHKLLLVLERMTYRTADRVISTNNSYREIAATRGKVALHNLTVVRSGPDDTTMRRGNVDPLLRDDCSYLCTYVGLINPQDGVEDLVRIADYVVHDLGRTDIKFALLGSGDCLVQVRGLITSLGLEANVIAPGWADDAAMVRFLSSSDVGLCPDMPSPLNNVSTMNKTLEYMAFGLPVVSYDLRETRVSAAEAAFYAPEATIESFAATLVSALADESARILAGEIGRQRIDSVLAWRHQQPNYVGVYQELVGEKRQPLRGTLMRVLANGLFSQR